MGTKTIQMKIYQMHDYDLSRYYTSLCSCGESGNKSRLSHIMKQLLKNHVRGTDYTAPQVIRYSSIEPKGVVRIRFTLDEKEDADIIACLKRVKRRQINGFLKSLLRSNISNSLPEGYFRHNEEMVMAEIVFHEKEEAPRSNRKSAAKAGSRGSRQPDGQKLGIHSDAVQPVHAQETEILPGNIFEEEDQTDGFFAQEQKQAHENSQVPGQKSSLQEDQDTKQNFDFFKEVGKLVNNF